MHALHPVIGLQAAGEQRSDYYDQLTNQESSTARKSGSKSRYLPWWSKTRELTETPPLSSILRAFRLLFAAHPDHLLQPPYAPRLKTIVLRTKASYFCTEKTTTILGARRFVAREQLLSWIAVLSAWRPAPRELLLHSAPSVKGSAVHRAFTSRMAGSLSSFPFLSEEEFEGACREFLARVHAVGNWRLGWSSIRLQTPGPVLKISQTLDGGFDSFPDDIPPSADPQDPQLEACEEDPEENIRTYDQCDSLQVDYEILLSPSYQVPVLYFVLRRADQPLGIDGVYRYLVPDQYRKEIQSVGIMGGISFGYHPVSGTPAFFVHPCNTADAMRDIAGRHNISPETYLIIWLGLVGNCLRLHLPSELFTTEGIPQLEGIE